MKSIFEHLSYTLLFVLLASVTVLFYVVKGIYYPPLPIEEMAAANIGTVIKVGDRIHRDSTAFYIQASMESYHAGEFQKSADQASRAVTMNPQNEYALNNLCSALIMLKQYEAALAACNKAIELAPNFENAIGNRDHTLYQMKLLQAGKSNE